MYCVYVLLLLLPLRLPLLLPPCCGCCCASLVLRRQQSGCNNRSLHIQQQSVGRGGSFSKDAQLTQSLRRTSAADIPNDLPQHSTTIQSNPDFEVL
uniref:GG16413 n=1 Tax=Drosophila erecta TaxID=7220 RepID=B3NZ51_DROER